MTMSRRKFIALGVAMTAGSALSPFSLANSGNPGSVPRSQIVHIPTGSSLDALFASGLANSQSEIKTGSIVIGPSMFSHWNDLLAAIRAEKGSFAAGVIDLWRYPLFEELLRESGASIVSVGRHENDRHRFTSLPASQGIGLCLTDSLTRIGLPANVGECAAHDVDEMELFPSSARAEAFRSASWPALVAEMYGRMAAGTWVTGKVNEAPIGKLASLEGGANHTSHKTSGFVTFAIQL
jgi:hypothetical protein